MRDVELRDRLLRVFGVANFSLCEALPWDMDAIQAYVLQMAEARTFDSFRITVQRSDKRSPGRRRTSSARSVPRSRRLPAPAWVEGAYLEMRRPGMRERSQRAADDSE